MQAEAPEPCWGLGTDPGLGGKISGGCPARHLSQPLHLQINSDKEGFSDVTHRYFMFMQGIIAGRKDAC